MDKTFLVFKPDSMENNMIINETIRLVLSKDLSIVRNQIVNLNESQIANIWPHLAQDPVCLFLQNSYINQKELSVFFIEGKDAIKQIDCIKNRIRKQYAKWQCSNCLHAPRNVSEYENDINIMFNSLPEASKQNFIHNDIPFHRFKLLSETELKECADILWSTIPQFNYKEMYNVLLTRAKIKKQKYIMLKNDNNNKLQFVVAAIYDYFQCLEIEDAYYISMAADWLGEFPMFLSSDEHDLCDAVSFFERNNINIEVCGVPNMILE